jgi:oxygen-independent coproporphyrinogen-3 oxidase
VGIYLHIPFCAHICPYCDFNTYSGQDALIPRYVAAMEREIARQGEVLQGPVAATISIGGGTPSLLEPSQIARLIAACRQHFTVLPDAEITMEANPNSFDAERATGYLAAGINRLSLGVQTQDHRGLRVLGRQHEASDAAAAFAAARLAGFTNINLDLIFGWPGQTSEMWRNDLETVLAWPGPSWVGQTGPDHLSLYSLIVEPGTPMADAVARGILKVPDDDAAADLYEFAIAFLAERGYAHYEIANWARSPELASRHNAIYWRNGTYLGIGAGAYGRVGSERILQHLRPIDFIRAVERGEAPVSNVETLDETTAIGETMMVGLRLLLTGVDAGACRRRHGYDLETIYGETIQRHIDLGLVERTASGIRLTYRGMLLANNVAADYLAPTLPDTVAQSGELTR